MKDEDGLIICRASVNVGTYSSTCAVKHHLLLGMALLGKESLLASSRTSDGETTSECRIFSTQIVHDVRCIKIHRFTAVRHEVPVPRVFYVHVIDLYQTNKNIIFSFRCHTLIMPSIPPLPSVSVPKPLNPQYHLLTCQSSLSPRPRPRRPQEQVAIPPLKVDCSRPEAVPPLLQSGKGPLTIQVAAYTMAQDVPVTTSMPEKLYVESQAVETGVDFPVEGIWKAGAGERDL